MPNYVNQLVDPSQAMRDSYNMLAGTERLMQGRERNTLLSSHLQMDQEKWNLEKMAVPFKFMQMKSDHIKNISKNISALPYNQRGQRYGAMLQVAETPIATHEKMGPVGVLEAKNFLPIDEFHNMTDEQQTAYLDVLSRTSDEVAKIDLADKQGLIRLQAIEAEAKAEVNKIILQDKKKMGQLEYQYNREAEIEKMKIEGRSDIATQKADIKAKQLEEEAKPLLTGEELEIAAENWMITGKVPAGRGKTMNKIKTEIVTRGLEIAAERGVSAQDLNLNQADVKAYNASLQQQEKQHGAMRSFITNIQGQVGRAKELANELDQFDTRLFNIPRREWKGKVIGSGLQKKYDLYLEELANEVGKVASGATGSVAELSQGAREAWSHILDKSLSPAELHKLLDETHHAVGIRLDSVEKALGFTRDAIKNIGTKGKKPKVTDRLDHTNKPQAGTIDVQKATEDYLNGL